VKLAKVLTLGGPPDWILLQAPSHGDIGQILSHPLAKELGVQDKLVNFAQEAIPVLLDKSEICGLRGDFLNVLIEAFPNIRPSIPEGTGPFGSSVFDDEEFLLSGIADIEYEYDYDTGEFLGEKEKEVDETTEAVTEATEVGETTTSLPEDSTELDVAENEVDVEPRRPKALGDEEEEEVDPFKKVRIGCCWYAVSQLQNGGRGRQPRLLGGFPGDPPVGQAPQKGRRPRYRAHRQELILDKLLRELAPHLKRLGPWALARAQDLGLFRPRPPPSPRPSYGPPSSHGPRPSYGARPSYGSSPRTDTRRGRLN
jgi:hypothetical protein